MAQKADLFPLFVIAAVLIAVSIPVYLGSRKIDAAGSACTEAGGTQVRTYEGFACIKGQKIK